MIHSLLSPARGGKGSLLTLLLYYHSAILSLRLETEDPFAYGWFLPGDDNRKLCVDPGTKYYNSYSIVNKVNSIKPLTFTESLRSADGGAVLAKTPQKAFTC
jgi:hypothetical protein